jgi:hypothetical protein
MAEQLLDFQNRKSYLAYMKKPLEQQSLLVVEVVFRQDFI